VKEAAAKIAPDDLAAAPGSDTNVKQNSFSSKHYFAVSGGIS